MRAALHINDAGITLLDAERLRYREAGFALLESDDLVTGAAALARARINPRHIQHRYWLSLSTQAFTERRFAHLSPADLASRQLETMWSAHGADIEELVVAVPAWLSAEQLGLLLGIANDIGMPVVAMADAAVSATRREYRGAAPVHIDMALHATTLSRLSQDGQAQLERSEILDDCGSFALFDAWLTTIAAAFVRQSRFDPLHTAATEQQLLDEMGAWLVQAGRAEVVALELTSGGVTHRAEIESLDLVAAAAPWYQQIASRLRALYRAAEIPAIQMTDRVARLPGLAELLKARVGGEVYGLEAGATARGALARCRKMRATDAGVSLTRQLPWDQQAMAVDVPAPEQSNAGLPTHLLFGDVAWQIGSEALQIGSGGGDDERTIVLDGNTPGLSRHHCSLSVSNGQCIVEDHSRFGTFLNGHRIDGSTVLQVGDSIRVGSPGFEFRLITTDESHGA